MKKTGNRKTHSKEIYEYVIACFFIYIHDQHAIRSIFAALQRISNIIDQLF